MFKAVDPATRALTIAMAAVGAGLVALFAFAVVSFNDPAGGSIWFLVFGLAAFLAAALNHARGYALKRAAEAFADPDDRTFKATLSRGVALAVFVVVFAQFAVPELRRFFAPVQGCECPTHWTVYAITFGTLGLLAAAVFAPAFARKPAPAATASKGFSWKWFLAPVVAGCALYAIWLIDIGAVG